jgi:hypothetical protein
MKKLIVTLLFLGLVEYASAQCAMCRTTLQNNVSQGNPGIAAGINFGILYLLAAPYLAVGLLGYFWYRSSKKNEKQPDQSLA